VRKKDVEVGRRREREQCIKCPTSEALDLNGAPRVSYVPRRSDAPTSITLSATVRYLDAGKERNKLLRSGCRRSIAQAHVSLIHSDVIRARVGRTGLYDSRKNPECLELSVCLAAIIRASQRYAFRARH